MRRRGTAGGGVRSHLSGEGAPDQHHLQLLSLSLRPGPPFQTFPPLFPTSEFFKPLEGPASRTSFHDRGPRSPGVHKARRAGARGHTETTEVLAEEHPGVLVPVQSPARPAQTQRLQRTAPVPQGSVGSWWRGLLTGSPSNSHEPRGKL